MGAGIAIIVCFSIFPLILTGAFKRVPNQKKTKGTIHSNEFSHVDRDIDGGGKKLILFLCSIFCRWERIFNKIKINYIT